LRIRRRGGGPGEVVGEREGGVGSEEVGKKEGEDSEETEVVVLPRGEVQEENIRK
jgi:hypothetical protein